MRRTENQRSLRILWGFHSTNGESRQIVTTADLWNLNSVVKSGQFPSPTLAQETREIEPMLRCWPISRAMSALEGRVASAQNKRRPIIGRAESLVRPSEHFELSPPERFYCSRTFHAASGTQLMKAHHQISRGVRVDCPEASNNEWSSGSEKRVR